MTNEKLKDSRRTSSCQAGCAGDGSSHKGPLNCLRRVSPLGFLPFQSLDYFGSCLDSVKSPEAVMGWNEDSLQGAVRLIFPSV